ncbi:MAG: MFS transporter [Bacillota bacterium]
MKQILGRVVALSLMMMMVMVGSSAVIPVLPQYARDFGVSIAAVGLVIATNSCMRMLVGFPAGVLTDRWGRRPFVIAGMLITAAGALVAWSATAVESLFVGQALIGIGAAFYATAALSMVVDMADATNRGKATGLYMMGFHLGAVFGPGIGGWLAYRCGINSPFLAFAVLAAVAAAAATFLTRETRPPQEPRAPAVIIKPDLPRENWSRALTRNLTIVYFLNFAFRFGFHGLTWTILPLLIEDLGLDTRVTGFIFMTLGGLTMLFFFPSGVLADRLGRRNVIIPGAVIAAGGFLLFRWAETLPLVIIASVLLGIGGGFISTIPAAMVGDFAPEKLRGTAMGIYRSMGDLGLVLAPVTLGFVATYAGLSATFFVTFALWFLTTLTLFLLPKGSPASVRAKSGKVEAARGT